MLRVRRALRGPARVVRYDRRGYARSRPAATSFDDQVDDPLAVLDGRRAAAGHSFGGLVCLPPPSATPSWCRRLAYEAPMPWEPWWPSQGAARPGLAGVPTGGPVDAGGPGRGRGSSAA